MSASIAKTEALVQAREHGLWGRADSPPEWQKALECASPGDPILVKDPSDPRDDFYLVPILPLDPAAIRSAWIMLDTVTFRLREAALLDHWKCPAFPDENDTKQIARNLLVLPDGTQAQFKPKDLKPNSKNLVWRAGDASILPYWPHKEWIAPHPLTGEPVSIFVTQEGEVLTNPTGSSHPASASSEPSGKPSPIRWLPALIAGLAIGMTLQAWRQDRKPSIAAVEPANTENFKEENEPLTELLTEERARITKLEDEIRVLTKRKVEADLLAAEQGRQIEVLRKKLAEFLTRKSSPKDADPNAVPRGNPKPTPVLPREKGPNEIPKP
jgi:hypothetical protein